MYLNEDQKYLPPKFSFALWEMAVHYDVFETRPEDTTSLNMTSNASIVS